MNLWKALFQNGLFFQLFPTCLSTANFWWPQIGCRFLSTNYGQGNTVKGESTEICPSGEHVCGLIIIQQFPFWKKCLYLCVCTSKSRTEKDTEVAATSRPDTTNSIQCNDDPAPKPEVKRCRDLQKNVWFIMQPIISFGKQLMGKIGWIVVGSRFPVMLHYPDKWIASGAFDGRFMNNFPFLDRIGFCWSIEVHRGTVRDFLGHFVCTFWRTRELIFACLLWVITERM